MDWREASVELPDGRRIILAVRLLDGRLDLRLTEETPGGGVRVLGGTP